MKKSLKFYKDIGFQTPTNDDNPPIVFFNNQGTKLELFPLEALAKDINNDNPPTLSTGGFSGITIACNMKSKEEVDEVFSLVEKSGGKIEKQPEWSKLWNGYGGYFSDPDGYYFEIAYGPDWSFDDNDMLLIE